MRWFALLDASGTVEEWVECNGTPQECGYDIPVERTIEVDGPRDGVWRMQGGELVEDQAMAERIALDELDTREPGNTECWRIVAARWVDEYQRLVKDARFVGPLGALVVAALKRDYPAIAAVADTGSISFADAADLVRRRVVVPIESDFTRAARRLLAIEAMARGESLAGRRKALRRLFKTGA